ncbi:MAG: Trk system potassium transporter TrkA [Desulfonatronovibrio sp.]
MRIIIIGAGQVGQNIAARLAQEKKEVILIDQNASALENISEQLDVQVVEGSGSSPKVLEQAGIKDCGILLAVTDRDEINLVACTFANMLSPKTRKLARIRNDEYLDYKDVWTKDLSISMVINPEVEVVRSIYRIMRAPKAVEINEFADGRIKLPVFLVEGDSLLDNVDLMKVRERIGVEDVVVAAIVRGEKLIIPSGRDKIIKDDLIYLACMDRDLDTISANLGGKSGKTKEVMIVGGGNIGFRLARFLEQKAFNVKLLEKNKDLCRLHSEKLDKTIVINGDGTDQNILKEENVKDMDLVVTLTEDDETNILSSLLSQKMGAAMTITRVNKQEYIPLVRTIGLKHIVSPRIAAVNTILNQIRKGSIISAVAIREDVDVMEALINGDESLVNKRIKEFNLPEDVLILAVLRGSEVILPDGETMIKPGDRITVLSSRKSIDRLEKALTAKLEYY